LIAPISVMANSCEWVIDHNQKVGEYLTFPHGEKTEGFSCGGMCSNLLCPEGGGTCKPWLVKDMGDGVSMQQCLCECPDPYVRREPEIRPY
jgi:hypothetical protein